MKITKRYLTRIIKEEMQAAEVPLEAIVSMLSGEAGTDSEEDEGRDLEHHGGSGEAKMTRAQLSHIQQDAGDLADMLNDDDELPEWMQSKVAAVADKMQDVHDYIEYKTGEVSETKQRLKRIIRNKYKKVIREAGGSEYHDIEPVEGVWSGDIEGKDRNLSLSIDFAKVSTDDSNVDAPEMLPAATPVLNNESAIVQIYRGQNDRGKRYRIPGIIYERYYDAYVSGNTDVASGILEEHLDTRFPGWEDYEWRS